MSQGRAQRIEIVDSHTGGEPTRLVVAGGPELGTGPLSERRARFASQFDHFRSAVVNEPRGSEALVGALLCPSNDPACVAGVIFFNNVGVIGMCGHGTMGVAVSLAHLGRIGPGIHKLETPVGTVAFEYDGGSRVAIENVPAYRLSAGIKVPLAGGAGNTGGEAVTGDIAWGGNWFFLTEDAGRELSVAHCPELTAHAWRIRRGLEAARLTGVNREVIDHIEITGPPHQLRHQGRNFVLCPGGAYDRSPCGTGTSAKLACLAADGKLAPGEIWRQESVTGSLFEAWYEQRGSQCVPHVAGTAYVNGEGTLLIDEGDPFAWGIRT